MCYRDVFMLNYTYTDAKQVIISNLCDQSVTGELVAGAVQCARVLRLFQPWRAQARITNEEHELADSAVRFLYCIEVNHALHQGMPPVSFWIFALCLVSDANASLAASQP